MVEGFINDAVVPAVTGRIVAAVAPHAGYVYSGKVAGYTFRAIRDSAKAGQGPDTVVILGFSHRGGFRGVAFMDGDAMATPIGEVALDKPSAASLVKQSPLFALTYAPHAGEHSAENEIPFAQVALPGTPIVVGLIGDHDPQTVKALVDALVELAGKKKIMVVASTDLLHDPDYAKVTEIDKQTMQQMAALDHRGLRKRWGYENQVCCGIAGVLTVLQFAEAQGVKRGTALRYRNSGDDFPEGRGSWVVGYGAVVFALPQ
jgi:AmmeMemoRadiSam system protein B